MNQQVSFVIFFQTLSNPLLFIQLLILSVYLLIFFRGTCCSSLSTLEPSYCWHHQQGLCLTESTGSWIQICQLTRITELTPFLFVCETWKCLKKPIHVRDLSEPSPPQFNLHSICFFTESNRIKQISL